MIRKALLLAAALACAAPALAQKKPATPTPEGSWLFKTKVIDASACTISGSMTVTRADKKGVHPCRFEAVQNCSGTPPVSYRTAQTCTIKVNGKKVAIVSKMEKFISIKPESHRADVLAHYTPDNFDVEINASASEMKGEFWSQGQAEVLFWRDKLNVS